MEYDLKNENDYLTPDDIGRILNLSRNTTYRLVGSVDFPKIRIGRQIRIPKAEFESYMKRYLYKQCNI